MLELSPIKELLRTEGHAETVGMKRSLHICRGHFADYTQGKGLFGRYQGRFWIPQHTRGSAELGLVEKSYNVSPHEETR